MDTKTLRYMALAITLSLGACAPDSDVGTGGKTAPESKTEPPVTPAPDPAVLTQSFEEAKSFLEEAAARDRAGKKTMTFEEFKATVFKEPFEGGKYIVNGDTPILNEKQLQEFFEQHIQQEPAAPTSAMSTTELIVHQVNNVDAVWNNTQKQQLTYCVSTEFGNRHGDVIAQMEAATGVWEMVSDVNFSHVAAEDNNCTAFNQNVVFDVRPVNVQGEYLARAFFPNEPRSTRNVLIDNTSFDLTPGDNLTLTGILRHELGHALGFRHEHTRPGSGTCFEDSNWRPLTDYDPFSVMHYPQCNGLGDWTLTLTQLDQTGVACLYGAAPGFTLDPAACPDGGGGTSPGTGVAKTESFPDKSVAWHEEDDDFPSFKVVPGTVFKAEMQGSGDPDLYVRFGQQPDRLQFDCRPYLSSANEVCELDVPADKQLAFIMVRGYAAGQYDLTVTYTSPAP